jgi:hypothetical protein
MRAAALSFFVLVTACGGAETPADPQELTESSRDDEPGSTRASREAAEPLSATDRVAPETPPTIVAPRPLVTVTPITIAEGEDGQGQLVPARRAVAVDLDARRFPPRALDPVLHVGALRFTRYTHPRPYVLRFVVADAALLAPGAQAYVQYGDDATSRVALPALEVSP